MNSKKYIPLFIIAALASASCTQKPADSFARHRLNDGIYVGAPDDWRWARDGIELSALRTLVGDPIRIEEPPTGFSNALTSLIFESSVENAHHRLLFTSDGFLVSVRWFEGIGSDDSLEAPVTNIDDDLRIAYPRRVPIGWDENGAEAYHIEVDTQYAQGHWERSAEYFTSQTRAIHQHTGANSGRWRVRALSNTGAGPWSDYVNFHCES